MAADNTQVTDGSTQIGGTHYKDNSGVCPHCGGEIQHWDLYGKQPYLEGCIAKYVTRWRSKNGLQDLLKAKHFLEKLIARVRMELDKHARDMVTRDDGPHDGAHRG
jgi:hypothetical protein